jgi:hypothetical protein
MNRSKMLSLMTLTVLAVMASGAASASATTLVIGGTKQTGAVTIEATLKSGTSTFLRDEFGTATDTCTTSTIKGTTSTFTGTTVSGALSSFTLSNCTHTTTVLAGGSLSVEQIAGTTNGTVSSKNTEVTAFSTFFGASAVCSTGSGRDLGTLTGVTSGNATIDINATINCGILGNSSLTATYLVTSPLGLNVES